MPYSFNENPPSRCVMGIATNSGRPGEAVHVSTNGFATSEDGEHFLQIVESLARPVLLRSPAQVSESQIDHLLAIHRPDGRVDVWVNELSLIAQTQIKGTVEKGAPVFRGSVADIRQVSVEGVCIPDDCGFFILVSSGWRKAVLYDFRPLGPGATPRERQFGSWLAAAYSWLTFRNRFCLTEDDWNRLMDQRWFPFVSLPDDVITDLLNYTRNGWDLSELQPRVIAAAQASLPDLRRVIEMRPLFEAHRGVLLEALDCFEKGQHKIAASGLYMRIEGLLRDRHFLRGNGEPTQNALSCAAELNDITHHFSPLMPVRFQAYLRACFFKPQNFDNPADATVVSRNTLGHGVVHSDLIDEKAATIGVLMLHQLAYLFANPA